MSQLQKSYGVTALLALLMAGPLGCVGIGGEVIDITHDELDVPSRTVSGRAIIGGVTDGRESNSRIGRATITVFAITSGSITTVKPLEEEVGEEIVAALETAGYDVTTTPTASASGATDPTVVVRVTEASFVNYNWVFPLVPTWGSFGLDISVQRGEDVVTTRSMEGSGTSMCLLGECAFSAATRRAMTELLNEVVEYAVTEEFSAAVE